MIKKSPSPCKNKRLKWDAIQKSLFYTHVPGGARDVCVSTNYYAVDSDAQVL